MFNSSKALSKVVLSLAWLMVTGYGLYYLFNILLNTYAGKMSWQTPDFTAKSVVLVIILVSLMLINWSIEALKWKMSIADIEYQSMLKALKATFVGVAISTWMPNRLGEYLGKVFFVKQHNRFKGAISALFVSYTQIIATTFFGLIGLLFYMLNFSDSGQMKWVAIFLPLVLLLMVIALSQKNKIRNIFANRNKYLRLFIITITRYGWQNSLKFIGLSALRFAVYNTQFVIALILFNVNLNFAEAFLMGSLIYGVQTVIPSTALAGLGIRGALSVYFISLIAVDFAETQVLSATYFIWTVNLLVPSFLGIIGLLLSPMRKDFKDIVLSWLKSKSVSA